MAIPTSEPQAVSKAGSVGVQPDINLGSNVFRAISGLGTAIKASAEEDRVARAKREAANLKLEEEAQKTIDKTVGYQTDSVNEDLRVRIDEIVRDPEIMHKPDLWLEAVNKAIEGDEAAFNSAKEGGSRDSIEAADFERLATIRDIRSELKGRVAEQINENNKLAAIQRYNQLGETHPDAAKHLINENDRFSPKEKQELIEDLDKKTSDRAAIRIENTLETLTIDNNIEGLSEQAEAIESGSGEYANLTPEELDNQRNIVQNKINTIETKQAKAYSSFLEGIVQTGTYSQFDFNQAVDAGLLTEEAADSLQKMVSGPTGAKGQIELKDRLNRHKEDKANALSYGVLEAKINKNWLTPFSEGDNPAMSKKDLTDMVAEIRASTELGIVSKNVLIARAIQAFSQSSLQQDKEGNFWIPTAFEDDLLGERWNKLDEPARKKLSDFGVKASKLLSKSIHTQLSLVGFDEEGKPLKQGFDSVEVFFDDLDGILDEMESGNPAKANQEIETRLEFYKTGFQSAMIRQALAGPSE